MEQPPGFVAQEECGLVYKLHQSLYGIKQSPHPCKSFKSKRSEVDHSVFYCHTFPKKCVCLIVYVHDIVITGNNVTKISQIKLHVHNQVQTKDLESLQYFLGIELAQSKVL